MSMKKSELKNLINEVIEEMSQDFYKDQLYLRATGPNQRAGGTSKWLKIRKIEDEGDSYAFFVIIRGEERSVGISKETIKSGKGTPNLEFQVRSMPATVNTVLHHYFSGNVNELRCHTNEGWKDAAKAIGAAGAIAGTAYLGSHLDKVAPKVEIGGQMCYVVPEDHGKVPNNALVLKGRDGKMYKVWQADKSGKYFAFPSGK